MQEYDVTPRFKLKLPNHLKPGAVITTAPERVPPRFRSGMQYGELKLYRRIRKNKRLSGNLAVRWICDCSCGKRVTVPEYYMKRKPNPKFHCGCLASTLKSIYKQEYGIWYMMHRRTEDVNHKFYHHYGGRGIKVCDEWNKSKDKAGTEIGFKNFLEHVGPRPSKKFSIDRIDNDGNYTPGNVKWSTAAEQRANQRPVGSTSK